MNDLDDLVALVRDELGLPVTRQDADADLDTLPGWDSVLLLQLLTVLEKATGRSLSLPDVLEAPTLARIYQLVAA